MEPGLSSFIDMTRALGHEPGPGPRRVRDVVLEEFRLQAHRPLCPGADSKLLSLWLIIVVRKHQSFPTLTPLLIAMKEWGQTYIQRKSGDA